jgi:hypothetical protein
MAVSLYRIEGGDGDRKRNIRSCWRKPARPMKDFDQTFIKYK